MPYPGLRRWAQNERRPIKNSPPKPKPDKGMFFRNVPGQMRVVIASDDGEHVLEFPDDGLVFLFINQEAAESLRDDLLDPREFPAVIE